LSGKEGKRENMGSLKRGGKRLGPSEREKNPIVALLGKPKSGSKRNCEGHANGVGFSYGKRDGKKKENTRHD